MKLSIKIVLLLLLAWVFSVACARGTANNQTAPKEKEAVAISSPLVKSASGGWQQEWDKTLVEARKEKKVVIYTSIRPIVREAWIKNFTSKFGVDLEFIMGTGPETRAKLSTERRAGITMGDLFFSGLTTLHLVLAPAGVFENFEKQLFLPEVLDPKAWFEGRLPWFTEERLIFLWRMYPTQNFWINTQLIKPGEIKSFRDLLKPQWKGGKFVLHDPTSSGSGSKWFEVFSREEMLGIDYMKALVKQEPVLTRNTRLGAEWVAMGKYPLSIAFTGTDYAAFLSVGAPVAFVETEESTYVTSGSGNLAWLKGSPHPAAAKLFANWLLSREGQEITQKAEKTQSAREDIGIEGIEVGEYRKKGVKYFNANTEEQYKNLEPLKQLAQEVFGPLVK